MTVNEAYNKFIYEKRIAGLSDKSIKAYYYQLIGFVRYVGMETDINSLSRKDIDEYLIDLYDSDVSKGTRSSYVRSVRIFLCWVAEKECLSFDPYKIIVPRSPKKHLRIYSDDEVSQIFGAIKNSIPWIEIRDKLIVALMYDSGLRQMEVCGLRWKDIQESMGTMIVYGKGDKERYVPIGDTSIKLMEMYKELCPYKNRSLVLCALDGTPLCPNAIKLMIQKLKKHLPFELSSHKLRHNFATNYCLDQYEQYGHVDSLSLKIVMGHSTLQTTEKYIHFATGLMAAKSSRSHLDKIVL